jgi:hypothetical protein
MGTELVVKEAVSAELVEVNNATGQIVSLEGKEGLVEKEVGIPPDLVYKIGYGEGGFYASFYDLVANIKAMKFHEPKTTYEDKDRVRVLVSVEYWNKEGKLVADSEEYEIDCQLLLEKARFGWERKKWDDKTKKMVVIESAKTKVVRDPKHPENAPRVEVVLPDDAETELYENFLTLRRNKLSKAITCAHRRLIQRAIGIKKFSADTKKDDWDAGVKIKLFSFLPADADRKAGIQAVSDLTGEAAPPEKGEVKKTAVKPNVATPAAPAAPAAPAKTDTSKEEKKESETTGAAGEVGGLKCTDCGAVVTEKVAKYSESRWGKIFCYDCQKKTGNKGK